MSHSQLVPINDSINQELEPSLPADESYPTSATDK